MSDRDSWATPQYIFDRLCEFAGFVPELDVACTHQNSKCQKGIFKGGDSLSNEAPWSYSWWCNPPYSKIEPWVDKAFESKHPGIMLLPNSTDTRWFGKLWRSGRCSFVFFEGRIQFVAPKGVSASTNTRGSIGVVVYTIPIEELGVPAVTQLSAKP